MPEINLFLDSSALFAGVISAIDAARALLLLAECEQISITISEQVVTETERAIARKVPKALADLRMAILESKAKINRDPTPEEVRANLGLISHPADVPILLAAMKAKVDYLVTFNRVHFMDDPEIAVRSGLRIGMPGEALDWVRKKLEEENS
jgi:predicted nucleic acid-binding protein